ncbi:NIPSNAP family protein [Methylobacterium sp. J-090]|uniref:NIPSNAP family protein n=1 Tax=Methylobacterium sp. J-090 TaxID=2836666 RepID=UPI001FBA125C|nr:NIPSNAP family protein [Methylobacterium sp. J-090]MCJ2083512.1 NIPSNAP family protein [Methylobacterium sp. J-090]
MRGHPYRLRVARGSLDVIDPGKIEAFEEFGRRWIDLVNRHGGTHHGYDLPAEGASDRALALFSFPRIADDERSRSPFGQDPRFVEADHVRDETDCVIRTDRTFMRSLLPAGTGLSEG